MKAETLHVVSDYITEAFNFIALREGFRNGVPYFDTANPSRATIGYGFNIEVTDYLLLVLNELGIVDDTMTEAEITARRQAFTTAINGTPDGDDDSQFKANNKNLMRFFKTALTTIQKNM